MGITAVKAAASAGPRRHRRSKILIVVGVAVAGLAVVAVRQVFTPLGAAPLTATSGAVIQWWWAQSGPLEVMLPPAGSRPLRPGDVNQGIVFIVRNDSDIALRVAPSGDGIIDVAISSASVGHMSAPSPRAEYRSSATIPPHQARLVRVLLTKMAACQPYGPGTSLGIDAVTLKVRAGRVTRNETVRFGRTVAFTGPSDPAAVPACAGVR